MIVVTWCHRVLQPDEASLKPSERMLLDKICDAYYLPAWCSVADYKKLFGEDCIVWHQGSSTSPPQMHSMWALHVVVVPCCSA